ncbi:MAG TPA: hypothetical protein PKX78_03000 [Candidatus Woesebacteria bacterium]|nr:hypothetical protein [Candidatus Woesebacteria bacterium]
MKQSEYLTSSCLGYSLIELLVALGLFAFMLPVIFSGFVAIRDGKPQQLQRMMATSLLNEAKEAVRVVREKDWSEFAVDGVYHPAVDHINGTWTLLPDSILIDDNFTQTVTISSVQRNPAGEIVLSGGEVDPSIKRVDMEVSWLKPQIGTLQTSSYLTRYIDNQQHLDTTEADFNAGTLIDVAVTNDDNGEVILGSGGQGDWCKPAQYILAELDLPGSGSARDVEAIEGKAFTGTNAGSGTFVEVAITNELPPLVSIESLMTGYDTNDVFIDANYAYVATQDISRDVIIIDLATGQEVGYFNDPDWIGSAQGVYVRGNVGYVTIGPRLHTFDLSQKTGARPQLDSVPLEGGWFWFLATGYRLQVVGDYAYVAVNIGSAELRLINVANPSNLLRAARSDVNGEKGQEVFVNETGTRVYLATTGSSSKKELFVINAGVSTNNKNNSSYNLPVIAEYEANGMSPRGVKAVPGNIVLLVGVGGEEYQALRVNENNGVTTLTKCGGYTTGTGIYGLATVMESDEDAYSYVVTADTDGEFKVIQGGPGASLAAEGWYESVVLDWGHEVGWNYLDFSSQIPVNTSLELQLAGADAVAGSCGGAVYNFVGPDKTGNTVFTQSGTIPFDNDGAGFENPAQCFKYRAHLMTSDGTTSPVLEDVQVNYSP